MHLIDHDLSWTLMAVFAHFFSLHSFCFFLVLFFSFLSLSIDRTLYSSLVTLPVHSLIFEGRAWKSRWEICGHTCVHLELHFRMIGPCPCMTEPPRVCLLSWAGQILHAWLSQYHTWRCKSAWQHPERRGGEAAGGRGHGVIYHRICKLPRNPLHFSTLSPPPPHLESLDPVWTSPEAGSLRAAATSCVQWDRIYGTCQLRFPSRTTAGSVTPPPVIS